MALPHQTPRHGPPRSKVLLHPVLRDRTTPTLPKANQIRSPRARRQFPQLRNNVGCLVALTPGLRFFRATNAKGRLIPPHGGL